MSTVVIDNKMLIESYDKVCKLRSLCKSIRLKCGGLDKKYYTDWMDFKDECLFGAFSYSWYFRGFKLYSRRPKANKLYNTASDWVRTINSYHRWYNMALLGSPVTLDEDEAQELFRLYKRIGVVL